MSCSLLLASKPLQLQLQSECATALRLGFKSGKTGGQKCKTDSAFGVPYWHSTSQRRRGGKVIPSFRSMPSLPFAWMLQRVSRHTGKPLAPKKATGDVSPTFVRLWTFFAAALAVSAWRSGSIASEKQTTDRISRARNFKSRMRMWQTENCAT